MFLVSKKKKRVRMGQVRGARKTDNDPNTEKMRRRYTAERVLLTNVKNVKRQFLRDSEKT